MLKKFFSKALKPVKNKKGDGVGTVVVGLVILGLALIAIFLIFPKLGGKVNDTVVGVQERIDDVSSTLEGINIVPDDLFEQGPDSGGEDADSES